MIGDLKMNQYKIMIIEDDSLIQNELQVLLNSNNYQTITCLLYTSPSPRD